MHYLITFLLVFSTSNISYAQGLPISNSLDNTKSSRSKYVVQQELDTQKESIDFYRKQSGYLSLLKDRLEENKLDSTVTENFFIEQRNKANQIKEISENLNDQIKESTFSETRISVNKTISDVSSSIATARDSIRSRTFYVADLLADYDRFVSESYGVQSGGVGYERAISPNTPLNEAPWPPYEDIGLNEQIQNYKRSIGYEHKYLLDRIQRAETSFKQLQELESEAKSNIEKGINDSTFSKPGTPAAKAQEIYEKLSKELESIEKNNQVQSSIDTMMTYAVYAMIVSIPLMFLTLRFFEKDLAKKIVDERVLIEVLSMGFLLLTVIILGTGRYLDTQALGPILGTIAGYIFGRKTGDIVRDTITPEPSNNTTVIVPANDAETIPSQK